MTSVRSGLARPVLSVVLAIALLPVPVLGWLTAQTFTSRIAEYFQFTGALIHSAAASTFAVVFFASALINAIIVVARHRDSPRSYRLSRYPTWQMIVLSLGIGWLACLVIDNQQAVEVILAAAIAASSIVACVFASLKDPESTERRATRVSTLRAARTPAAQRRVRLAKIFAPLLILLLGVSGLVAAQNLEVVYHSCVLKGMGDVSGRKSFYTYNCGDFAVDERQLSHSDLEDSFSQSGVDVTTRGFEFGFPPLPVAIAISPAG